MIKLFPNLKLPIMLSSALNLFKLHSFTLLGKTSTALLPFEHNFFTYPASTWARCISPVLLLVKQDSFHQSNL